MKVLLPFLLLLAASTAHAHPSLVPHHHPHGVSMLPDLDTIVVAMFALAAALIAYWKFGRG
jgi:hypothetical protein